MAVHGITQHSTLEVNIHGSTEHDGIAGLIVGQDPEDEKMLGYSSEKEADHSDIGKQLDLAGTANSICLNTEGRILGLKRKIILVLLVASLVLIIAGAIGGGVDGIKSMQDQRKGICWQSSIECYHPLKYHAVKYFDTVREYWYGSYSMD